MTLKTSDVFGVNTEVNDYSYVDRGNLDDEIRRLSNRNTHLCLKGESKAGKSWLRQKSFPNAVVIQCRLGNSTSDIYTSILSELDINLVVKTTGKSSGTLEFSGKGAIGWSLLAKVQAQLKGSGSLEKGYEKKPIGKDQNDLKFICDIIKASERRVVIEDFHYLSHEAQREIAHDLKAFWDYSTYLVIVGVWVKRNYLTHLNADLAGRISEVSVYWNESDLKKVVEKGRLHLNIVIAPDITNRIVNDSFGNVGLLQNLVLETLDHSQIFEKKDTPQVCEKQEFFESAALSYAEQLEAVYLEFSRRVSKGIRKRKGSTKIYAYAMQACFEASDEELINGVEFGTIYRRANERQPRVQQGNLKSILRKIDGLQIDDRGKGLEPVAVNRPHTLRL